ncbi:MAG: bis(5'-nucleosyl)-tetraphosphatase (symmetrical) YqeK [Limnochordia bacterium]|jgi:predicted HD superfamily hydrolase involved in NAD metabolism
MSCLAALAHGIPFYGDTRADMVRFLACHGHHKTISHSMCVAEEAGRLAIRWNESAAHAQVAGWLHDISAVIPNGERISVAEHLGLDILPEERTAPMIMHQKLSAEIASELFGVSNKEILSAIACHTTLKADASKLDKIVFVADKICWDQSGDPPYLGQILEAAEHSLDKAACIYLEYLWRRRNELPVLHPRVEDAHKQLRCSGLFSYEGP